MKLTHNDLMDCLSCILELSAEDTKIVKKGICLGFSMMLSSVVLTGKTDVFFQRLQLIEKYKDYQDDFEQLKKEIDAVKEKVRKYENISPKEEILLDVLAFNDGILFSQLKYEELFSCCPWILCTQFFFHNVYSIIGSEKVDNAFILNPYSKFFKKKHILNQEDLAHYFDKLEVILRTTSVNAPVFLMTQKHVVLMWYDQEKQTLQAKEGRRPRPVVPGSLRPDVFPKEKYKAPEKASSHWGA